MKIIVDDTAAGSPHALTKEDVRLIFSSVPPEWIDGIQSVRLANGHGGPNAYLRPGELSIRSRGRSKNLVVTAILNQLAMNGLGQRRYWGRLTKADLGKVATLVEPLLNALTPKFQPQLLFERGQNLSGFVEMKFPFVPNDPIADED